MRYSLLGRGRGSGARVVHFHSSEEIPIYALSAHAKSARIALSPSDRRAVFGIAAAIKETGK